MHHRLLISFLLLAYLSHFTLAQHKTFFGVEGSLARDVYVIDDNGASLVTVPLGTGLAGINIRHEIGSRAFGEIRVVYKTYWQGFGFRNVPVWSTSDAFEALLTSVKVGYRIPFLRKFFLVPSAGVTFGVNMLPEVASGSGSGRIVSNGTTITYDYDENDDVARTYFMAHPSIGIERQWPGVFVIGIYASRPFGFSTVHQLDIQYTINNSPHIAAKAVSRGDYWSVGVGLRYPVSNLWRKRQHTNKHAQPGPDPVFSSVAPVRSGGSATYLGISVNVGNRMRYSPASPGLKTPLSLSGNLVLNIRERLPGGLAVQYGAGLGVLGYNLKVIAIDSILNGEKLVFREYATFYGSLHLLLGKEFQINTKSAFVGLGGGGSYYYSAYPSTRYGVEVVVDGQVKNTFEAQAFVPENRVVGFAKIAAQVDLTRRFAVGLEYAHHFRPVISGWYAFHHTKVPAEGRMELYQREVKVVVMVRVGSRTGS